MNRRGFLSSLLVLPFAPKLVTAEFQNVDHLPASSFGMSFHNDAFSMVAAPMQINRFDMLWGYGNLNSNSEMTKLILSLPPNWSEKFPASRLPA